MLERMIIGSHTQRLLVCFAWLVLMCSEFYTFRYIVCRSPWQLGSA
jgi:hypothetical protein